MDQRTGRGRVVREKDVEALLELWDRVAPDSVDEIEDALVAEIGLEDTLGKLRQEKAVL